ncbi:hypothetical protein GF407_02880 [candidate division KSB1 bacterium]|nr:hypothetical protein [candidate division KSB1 bacterium]
MTHKHPENIWTLMWFKPRQAMRMVLNSPLSYHYHVLIIFGGIGQALSNASAQGMGKLFSTAQIITICLILGPLSGYLSVLIGGWILKWVGDKLSGHGSLQDLRRAIAWSWVPVVSTLPLWIVKWLLFRDEVFTIETPFIDSQPVLRQLYDFIGFVDLVIGLWVLIILYNTVSEAHGFTLWKGVGTVILSGVLLMIPLLLMISLCGLPVAM